MSGLTGGKELARLLNAFPKEIRGKVMRSAALAGASEIRKEMAKRAPERGGGEPSKRIGKKGTKSGGRMREPGFLADNFASTVARRQVNEDRVIVKSGPNRDAYYGNVYERGRKGHGGRALAKRGGKGKKGAKRGNFWTRALGRSVGATPAQPARPFMGAATEAAAPRALDRLGKALGLGIERASKRLAGRYMKSGLSRRGTLTGMFGFR